MEAHLSGDGERSGSPARLWVLQQAGSPAPQYGALSAGRFALTRAQSPHWSPHSTAPQTSSAPERTEALRRTWTMPTAQFQSHHSSGLAEGSISATQRPMDAASGPELTTEALYGLPGRVVNAILPHSEASAAALLVQFLAATGNSFGRGAYFPIEGDQHTTTCSSPSWATRARGARAHPGGGSANS
jgi:hypothetical protein